MSADRLNWDTFANDQITKLHTPGKVSERSHGFLELFLGFTN